MEKTDLLVTMPNWLKMAMPAPAQGNSLAVYSSPLPGEPEGAYWREQQLYGSSRLGMWKPNVNLATPPDVNVWNNTARKNYELNNHLGNVMAVITEDRDLNGGDIQPTLTSSQDYYSFGGQVTGRKGGLAYRYGFNGKENDDEVKGEGNQQDYGMRIYDPRIAKFLSVDPITSQYPELTPYQFAGNTPIQAIDLDGLEPAYSEKSGKRVLARDGGLSSAAFRPKPKIQAMSDKRVYEQTVLKPDMFGVGHIGKESYVNYSITMVEQRHRDQMGELVRNSPTAAVASFFGEKYIPLGAAIGGMTMSIATMKEPAFFGPKVEIETEPIYRLPTSNGSWSGKPGNSSWKSTINAVNSITNGESIPFVNGRPNFTKWALATFKVDGLSGGKTDFSLIYKQMVTDFGFKNPTAAQDWLRDNKLTPHHDTGNIVQLVPTVINNIPHTGGASDLRNK